MSNLLKEVQQSLKVEAWHALLRRYAPYVMLCVVLFFVFMGGFLWWQHKAQEKAKRQSTAYEKALVLMEANKFDDAQVLLKQLRAEAGKTGYGFLASMGLVVCAYQEVKRQYILQASAKGIEDARNAWLQQIDALQDICQEDSPKVWLPVIQTVKAYQALNLAQKSDVDLRQFDTPQHPFRELGLRGSLVSLVVHKRAANVKPHITPAQAQKAFSNLLQHAAQQPQALAMLQHFARGAETMGITMNTGSTT